ncbi:MAG: hypothetical protein EH225_08780 [Calditrichaeota bacterium]|nr:hypothetical protein [Calditrichota bacterium]RQW02251.1 MAG: hypothetical protein EH225_08780 [Calditrichota bacterium]
MYYLGLDGGGTKTAAVLCDAEGKILRKTRMGPGNIAVLDRGSLAQLIRNILAELLQGEKIESIEWGTFAFAGAGRPEEKKTASELLRGVGLKNFSVLSDGEILYYSIFGDETGILIAAGTGSICLLKTKQGKFKQLGGWGYLLGDEGSGFDIGRMAIQTVLDDLSTGKKPSGFSDKILRFYGLENPDNLISIIYSSINPPNLIASCAKLVSELAELNQPEATRIIEKATDSLVEYAEQAVHYVGNNSLGSYNVALAGGILRKSSYINQRFKEKIEKKGLNFKYWTQDFEPAAAGVVYSFRQLNRIVPPSLMDALKEIKF